MAKEGLLNISVDKEPLASDAALGKREAPKEKPAADADSGFLST